MYMYSLNTASTTTTPVGNHSGALGRFRQGRMQNLNVERCEHVYSYRTCTCRSLLYRYSYEFWLATHMIATRIASMQGSLTTRFAQ